MGSVNIDDALLFELATACAEHKIRGTCNKDCAHCASNISIYGLSPTRAVLIQQAANVKVERRYNADRQYEAKLRGYAEDRHRVVRATGIVQLVYFLIVILIIIVPFLIHGATKKKEAPQAPSSQPTIQKPVAVEDLFEPIRQTLRKITIKDMNDNGAVTCVDYTIQFYTLYPDKSKVRMIQNYNHDTGWNHLFVCVDGVMVEPSAYLDRENKDRWFDMVKYWGNTYNPKWNKDVTISAEQIVRGEVWR
jgi:hypothetical protein